MSTIGAVVITYNTTPGQLGRCLASLKQPLVTRIVVVDNTIDVSSAKQLHAMSQKYGADYIATSENKGFATASNQGAGYCSEEFILFLNPDSRIIDGQLATVNQYFNTHTRCAIVGLQLQSAEQLPEPASYGKPVSIVSLVARKFETSPFVTEPKKVGWVSGGAMMVRSAHFKQLNGFDPQFFMYWEDVDLCKRAGDAGLSVVVHPGVNVEHQRGMSTTSKQKTAYYDESADKYFHKQYPKSTWLLQRLIRYWYRKVSPLAQ